MEWISVKDKLPNDTQRVLATDGKEQEVTYFFEADGDWVAADSLFIITHWMPLPELPNQM